MKQIKQFISSSWPRPSQGLEKHTWKHIHINNTIQTEQVAFEYLGTHTHKHTHPHTNTHTAHIQHNYEKERGHEFEREQGKAEEWVWEEERERRNDVIILYSQNIKEIILNQAF